MSFKRRAIDVTFTLGQGSFGDSGQTSTKLTGFRIGARVQKAGTPSMSTLAMQVYGMKFSEMNKLSTLGMKITEVRRNSVIVEAGNEGETKSIVFEGTITNAWADFAGAPNVAFHVEAHTGLLEAVKPVAPSSYNGPTDLANVMADLAGKAGLQFQNNGVSVILDGPYYYGSARNQMIACAEAGFFNMIIENKTLFIWPKGKARSGNAVLISPETGMMGYPAYTSKGVLLTTLFNPAIEYGDAIEVKSSLGPANGPWNSFSIDHDLDAITPNGKWQTSIGVVRPGLQVVE